MDDVMQTRVASALTAVAGGWLLASPLVISITGAELISTLAAGGVLVLAGIVQFFWENTIPSWVTGITAAWMAVSAVVFGMSGALLWSTIVAAGVAFVLALWDGLEVSEVAQHHVRA